MLKGNVKRYKINDQNVKGNPSEYIMMECVYCGSNFYVGMNILHWVNQGYQTHCGAELCRRKHKTRQRARWQNCRVLRTIIKSPRQQRVMKEKNEREVKMSKIRRFEDEKFKEQSRNWFFGPGDIFYDVIVAPMLKQLKKEEKKFEKFMVENACMNQAEYREYEEYRARELKEDMGDPKGIINDLEDLAGIGKKQDLTKKNEG